MRYFSIAITSPTDGTLFVPSTSVYTQGYVSASGSPRSASGQLPAATYTSLQDGGNLTTPGFTNPAALRCEMDIMTTALHQPMPGQYLKLSNVSLGEAANVQGLQHMNIAVSGGFAKGLPLANPSQAGLLCAGQIRNCFGNWIAGEQSVVFYIFAKGSAASSNQTTTSPPTLNTPAIPATIDTPANITFQWQSGEPLLTPLVRTLQTTFPQYQINGAISPSLIWAGTAETAFFPTLGTFAQYVHQKSLSVMGGYAPSLANYMGVHIAMQGNSITVFDGTTLTTPKTILFDDLVGQPTSAEPYIVQAITMMRADISVGDHVKLPLTPFTLSGPNGGLAPPSPSLGNSAAQARYATANTGIYTVTSVRHLGDSQGEAATDWVTVLELRQNNLATAAQPAVATPASSYPGNPASSSTPPTYPVIARPNTNAYQFYLPGIVNPN